MNDSLPTVLVAYATRYGSSQEVAISVADELRARGLGVAVQPVEKVHDVARYRGVVLVAPFYVGSLLKSARTFLERIRDSLDRTPIALLALGPVSADDDLSAASAQLDDLLARTPWLHPVAAEMFVGRYDPKSLRGLDRLISALPASPLHGVEAHDDRDWDAIREWADALPASLHLPG